MGRLRRAVPGRAGAAAARGLPHQQRPRGAPAGGGCAYRGDVRRADAGGMRRQIAPGQHRLWLRQRLRGAAHPSGAAAGDGGDAGRADRHRRAAGALFGRAAAAGAGAGDRPALGGYPGGIRRRVESGFPLIPGTGMAILRHRAKRVDQLLQ